MPEISFVIINYNSCNYVNKLVMSLTEFVRRIKYEVVIYDNNSTEPQQFVCTQFEIDNGNIKVIHSDKNWGFGVGCNNAISYCRGEKIIILNPDLSIGNIDYIRLLEIYKKNIKIGVVTVQQISERMVPVYSFRPFPSILTSLMDLLLVNSIYYYFRQRIVTFRTRKYGFAEVDSISGAFILIDRQLFQSIGGFDPRYFMYVEETDLCFRLKKNGFKNILLTKYEVIHFQGKSSNSYLFEVENIHKNQIQFVEKHYGIMSGVIFGFIQNLNKLIRSVLYLMISYFIESKKNKFKSKVYFHVAKNSFFK